MTMPKSASPAVAANSHLSACSFLAILTAGVGGWGLGFGFFIQPLTPLPSPLYFLYSFLKDPPSVFETLEHVEAGASRGEEDDVARLGRFVCAAHGVKHVDGALHPSVALQLFFNRVG